MIKINQIKVPLNYKEEDIKKKICKLIKVKEQDIKKVQIIKESLDARKKPDLYYVLTVEAELFGEEKFLEKYRGKDAVKIEKQAYIFPESGKEVSKNRPIIIGAGPAGLFCGYYLALQGYKPILLERGKDVQSRLRDVEAFWQGDGLLPDSNVQFGEGGAGTFSDGKLNTMTKDKSGRNYEILKTFVEMGAPAEILYKNKPHIGTDILIHVVENLRNAIIEYGGEVHFESKVEEILIKDEHSQKRVCGIRLKNGEEMQSETVILAVGHSARDTFSMLHEKQIPMEPKAFAVGMRVEHLQSMINEEQLAMANLDGTGIKAADYKLTAQTASGRGVYSFCMCPGGYVVDASSERGHLVVNGMSYSGRNGINSNSAIVMTVTVEDFPDQTVLSGIAFQRKLEGKAYEAGGGKVPYQRYEDFIKDKETTSFGSVNPSVKGNYQAANLRHLLPEELNEAFIDGMEQFQRKIKGFAHKDTLLAGVEARTSSPVRILRDETFQSSVLGLYPCGEGAGYAGGITSAAVDGLKIAEAVAFKYAPFCNT